MKRGFRLIAAVLIAALFLPGCGNKVPVPELMVPIENPDAVFAAKKLTISSERTYEASICPDVTDVKFDFDSYAYDVQVKTGDFVKEGDVLFCLDKELRLQVKEAEAELALRKKNYEVAVKQHNDQIKGLQNLKNMFANMQDWYDYNLFDINLREAEAKFNLQYDSVYQDILKFEDEYLELKERYEQSEIKSPVDGQIVYLSVSHDGDPIYEDTTVVSVARQDIKLICCELIEEKDYNAFTDVKATIAGQQYEVTYIPYDEEELYNKRFRAKKLYSYFTVENLPSDVQFGDFATVTVTAVSEEPVLCVPKEAVTRSNGQNYVRVVSGDRQGMRPVTIGIGDKNYTEITSGLSEGETVFVANNLVRYGISYETQTPSTEDYRMDGNMSAFRRSLNSEPFINPVPGKIKEIYIPTYSQIYVTPGMKLYTITPEINESDWEEARQGLKLAKETYEKKLKDDKKSLDDQLKKIRDMRAGVERELAQLKYDIALEQYEQYILDGQETIDKWQKRLDSFDEWGKGEDITIYAEQEGYLSSFAKYTVGKELAADEVLCDFYYPDSLYYRNTDTQRRFRYGMTVDVEYSVNGETFKTTGKVISAYDVLPEEIYEPTEVFIMLSDEDNRKAGADIRISAEYCSAVKVMTIPSELVLRERRDRTDTDEEEEEEDPLTALLKKNSSEEEDEKGVPYVWVYDDNGQVVKRYITIVESNRLRAWVCDGLSENDRLVVH